MPNRNVGHIDEMTLANGVAAGSVIKHMAPGASGTRRRICSGGRNGLANRWDVSAIAKTPRADYAKGLERDG